MADHSHSAALTPRPRLWPTWWAIVGVSLLLAQALVRLTPLAIEPWIDGTLSDVQAGLYVVWVGFNAYAEGYRGFQKRFCPRVTGRALALIGQPLGVRSLLAPAYAMGLFAAPRREFITAWAFLVAIVILVALVRLVPQPWRGIIDGGVVVGLVWGVVALWTQFSRSLCGCSRRDSLG